MVIELFAEGASGVIRIGGTLNLDSLKEFDQQIKSLDFNGLQTVILNLQELEHIDSSGVSGIIQLHKILSAHSVDMRVGNISTRVHRLFEQMHLFEIIPKI